MRKITREGGRGGWGTYIVLRAAPLNRISGKLIAESFDMRIILDKSDDGELCLGSCDPELELL